MNEKQKMYTEDAVDEALKLTALAVAGILPEKEAEEGLGKLPADLKRKVIANTMAAFTTRDMVMQLLPSKETLKEILEKLTAKKGE